MAESIIQKAMVPKLEYINDVYWWEGQWTCPDDGVVIAELGSNTSGSTAYWYIYDNTLVVAVGKMTQNANGTSQTVSFPVIKGHVYNTLGMDAASSAHAYYYKYV